MGAQSIAQSRRDASMEMQMGYIVGVDIGGTFTDAAAVDTENGTVHTAKARSTPDDLAHGLLEALQLVADAAGVLLDDLLGRTEKFAHGTTQTSNVIFTWDGADTGLITTRGFADELLIMRARGRVAGLSLSERRHLRTTSKPHQIVPRARILEVTERVDYLGRVLVPLDEDEVRDAVHQLLGEGVESIAVSLIWSPANPEHERRVREIIREHDNAVHVTLSHELAPLIGEYERTATAVVNAFVAPTVESYLRRVESVLQDHGLRVPLLVLQASGGVTQAAQTVPVHTIESGPAAGMVAVKAVANASGYRNVIATDVGGTTFKVGILADGSWEVARETTINQYTLSVPIVDLVSLGAGGGSIAWVDAGRLRVGPQSAGSEPGPACYGWGGTQPTVTDADLVLGFLHPERFLGGRLTLQPKLAEQAIRRHIADPLFDGDVVQAATGIRRIVDSQMADLLRKTTIERGYDPREFALMAYGGAGPLHAAGYAAGLGVSTIIIPRAATAYSAYGAASCDIHHSLQWSARQLSPRDEELGELYRSLDERAVKLLRQQGVGDAAMSLSHWADMRYARQLHDLRVTLSPDVDTADPGEALEDAFGKRYAQLYGSGALLDGVDIQILSVGTEAVGAISKPAIETWPVVEASAAQAPREVRDVFWPDAGRWTPTGIHDGTRLRPGHEIDGPAVIEHAGTTIVVPRGAHAHIDAFGSTVITLAQEA